MSRTRATGREPALPELLDDPIVEALMRADRVGRYELEADLHRLMALQPSRPSRIQPNAGSRS